ncbi:MAG: hypothetical protein K6G17_08465 [Oscillospiraceae bacterium]|nr:hypothetical protein [Oscillospiraceae bacterium]
MNGMNERGRWVCPACETINEGGEVCAACGLSRREAEELLRGQTAPAPAPAQAPQQAYVPEAEPAPVPRRKENRWLAPVLALLLIAALAVGGWFVWQRFSESGGREREKEKQSGFERTLSDWSVIGEFGGTYWDTDWVMYEEEPNVFRSLPIEFHAGEAFKLRWQGSWEMNYGYGCVRDGDNMEIREDGVYIIELDLNRMKITVYLA